MAGSRDYVFPKKGELYLGYKKIRNEGLYVKGIALVTVRI